MGTVRWPPGSRVGGVGSPPLVPIGGSPVWMDLEPGWAPRWVGGVDRSLLNPSPFFVGLRRAGTRGSRVKKEIWSRMRGFPRALERSGMPDRTPSPSERAIEPRDRGGMHPRHHRFPSAPDSRLFPFAFSPSLPWLEGSPLPLGLWASRTPSPWGSDGMDPPGPLLSSPHFSSSPLEHHTRWPPPQPRGPRSPPLQGPGRDTCALPSACRSRETCRRKRPPPKEPRTCERCEEKSVGTKRGEGNLQRNEKDVRLRSIKRRRKKAGSMRWREAGEHVLVQRE
eukprot:scaffold776_cov347-Pavlova_lutheri.AAC.106